MVRAKVRLNFVWPKKVPVSPKYDLEPLLSYAKQPFQLNLSNRFSMLSDVQDPEKIFEEIESGILTSAAEVLPLKETSRKLKGPTVSVGQGQNSGLSNFRIYS